MPKVTEEYALACRRAVAVVDRAFDELFVALEVTKAGFNPGQPRVPAGNAEGGQWTAGIGDFRGSVPLGRLVGGEGFGSARDRLGIGGGRPTATIKPVYKPLSKISSPRGSEGRGKSVVNVFVGGADDEEGLLGNHPVRNSSSLREGVYGNNYYANHTQDMDIGSFITRLPKNITINLIGHSYGGDTAAKIAVANPGRVEMLVTVDPTSWIRPDFSKVRNSVGTWINVNAVGKPGSYSVGNFFAGVGGRWKNDPKGYSHVFISAYENHPEFQRMMVVRDNDQQKSPAEMLNALSDK
ncbi:MAG: alpha/beta hydrolase [Alphaproteobacteria bacterium]|nr:alpha/beta hydrolase [Alphaproteobacteria bacterium]